MKKSLIALAVLSASGLAMAQSSVTLYGVVDTGPTYIKGDKNVYGLTNYGGTTNSRLGLRGTEDLGGGLKAIFNLEGGIGTDTGEGKAAGGGFDFKRTSYVGLEGGFGIVRFGRELTASYLAVSRYDPFGDTGIGATRFWGNGYAARVENGITYYTPNIAGFKLGVNYGFGEQTASRDNRYITLGATYDNGPLSVGFGYDKLNGNRVGGLNPAAEDLTTWQLGGSYDLGAAKLAAAYKNTKYKDDLGNSEKLKSYMLGVTAPVGAGKIKAAYSHYKWSDSSAKANEFSLGYVYDLSKRTAVYGTYAYLKNKNGATFGLNAGNLATSAGLTASGKQQGLQVGIRHAF
ncbi:porin [Comamonas faecalis]|uniref:Porin n=1 Tax=Comamonas faecalis TaxID=1387849 RepID=A0ABP7RBW9_9BURK